MTRVAKAAAADGWRGRIKNHERWGKHFPLFAALIVPLSFAVYVLQIYLHGDAGAKVFASYWASGRQLALGADPYAFRPDVWVFTTKSGEVVRDINLNAPIFLPVCRAFGLLPLQASALIWGIVSCLGFALSIAWMNRQARPHWLKAGWCFLFLPVWDSIIIGQNYLILFLLALAAWWGIRRSRIMLAAISLGLLIALKPNFALALPILFLAGHRRLAILAGVAMVMFWLLPAVAYGPKIYGQWLSALREDNHWIFTTTISIPAYFQRLGAKGLGLVLAAAAFLTVSIIAWRKRPDAELATMLGLMVGILVSPLAWFHYLLVLLPFLVSRRWTRATTAGALALVVLQPTIILYAMGKGWFVLATLGGAMLLATLLLTIGILQEVLGTAAPGRDRPEHA